MIKTIHFCQAFMQSETVPIKTPEKNQELGSLELVDWL